MRTSLRAGLGAGLGAALLWIALSRIDLGSALVALRAAPPHYSLAALILYWGDIALRIARWRLLLNQNSRLSYRQVGQALIVGYAVNNILPARLGEVFRADFIGRQFGIGRVAALGSIVVERMLDGIIVVGLLCLGLAIAPLEDPAGVLTGIALAGALGVVAGVAAMVALTFFHVRLPLDRMPWIKPRLLALADAFAVLRSFALLPVVTLSAFIWLLECGAFDLIAMACGASLNLPALCITVGAASLSSLLPSAPGYLGSYQIAFVLAFSALDLSAGAGVAAATLTQIVLLGSITLSGLAILTLVTIVGRKKLKPS